MLRKEPFTSLFLWVECAFQTHLRWIDMAVVFPAKEGTMECSFQAADRFGRCHLSSPPVEAWADTVVTIAQCNLGQ